MLRQSMFLLLVVLHSGTVSVNWAQVGNAMLVGRVTDPTAGVVAAAEVQIKRLSTNETWATRTTVSGDYTIANLPVDTYEIRVASSGFRTEVRTRIRLEVGQTARIDFQLSVGSVTESVEVVAEAPILRTEQPEFGQVINNQRIQSLPLNTRDVLGSFASLTPGVAPARSNRLGGGSNFNVRGQRAIDNVVLLDGGTISQGNAFVTFNTNPDSVQEFEVKTGLYGAEYGIRPGGQFSIITKSGTNDVHGTLFELLRNDNLDARNFFDRGRRPEFKRNQFGASVGGPIYIPKVFNGKDRAWFFTSYSGERIRRFNSLTGVVPTADEKAGRFARTITDPLNGQPFPNNTIPSARFNPVAQKLVTFYPDPNTAGQAFNFTSPDSSNNANNNQFIAKVDFRVTDTDRWSARFLWDDSPITRVAAINVFRRVDPLSSFSQTISNTRTIKARYVNQFSANFYRRPYYAGFQSSSPGFGRTLGIPNFPSSVTDENGVPVTAVTGLLTIGDGTQTGPSITGHWEVRDHLTFSKGAHFLKTGYQWRRHIEFYAFIRRAAFTFNPRYTGAAFADFMLGYLTNTTQGNEDLRGRLNQNGHYFYLQDSWKATSRLTLDLGLRYEYRGPWRDQRGFNSNFSFETGTFNPPLSNNARQPWETGRFVPNVPYLEVNKRGWQPRVGLAYRATDKTVVRAGYGAYGNEPTLGLVQDMGRNPRPGAEVRQFLSDPRTPNVFLSNPFDTSVVAPGVGVPIINGFESPLPQSVVHSWGLAIQQQLSPNTAFEIGYQGSHAVHDYVPTQANDATPGPGARQQRRPYPQYNDIRIVRAAGDSSYNGMELKLERRPGPSGLSLLLAYTWSKTISTVGPRLNGGGDPFFLSRNMTLAANRGAGEQNPQRLTMNAGYEVPLGPGKKYLTHGVAGHIFGGWSTYGILSFEKGFYVTSDIPTDILDVGSTASSRPDLLRSPNLEPSARTPQRWFDTTAFATPAQYRYGNAGRSVIEGPGLANLDVAVLRSFRTSESSRLEFRFEAFNATNHTNFSLPGLGFGTPTFGVIGSALESRDLQFGLKFYF